MGTNQQTANHRECVLCSTFITHFLILTGALQVVCSQRYYKGHLEVQGAKSCKAALICICGGAFLLSGGSGFSDGSDKTK